MNWWRIYFAVTHWTKKVANFLFRVRFECRRRGKIEKMAIFVDIFGKTHPHTSRYWNSTFFFRSTNNLLHFLSIVVRFRFWMIISTWLRTSYLHDTSPNEIKTMRSKKKNALYVLRMHRLTTIDVSFSLFGDWFKFITTENCNSPTKNNSFDGCTDIYTLGCRSDS